MEPRHYITAQISALPAVSTKHKNSNDGRHHLFFLPLLRLVRVDASLALFFKHGFHKVLASLIVQDDPTPSLRHQQFLVLAAQELVLLSKSWFFGCQNTNWFEIKHQLWTSPVVEKGSILEWISLATSCLLNQSQAWFHLMFMAQPAKPPHTVSVHILFISESKLTERGSSRSWFVMLALWESESFMMFVMLLIFIYMTCLVSVLISTLMHISVSCDELIWLVNTADTSKSEQKTKTFLVYFLISQVILLDVLMNSLLIFCCCNIFSLSKHEWKCCTFSHCHAVVLFLGK